MREVVVTIDQAGLQQLPVTRRALLTLLKKQGELRADQLAEGLSITVSAVRQHLAGLLDDGLVEFRELRQGPGRPIHLYRLTADGDSLFPRAYGELASELLTYVEDEEPELVDRVFERRRKRRVEQAAVRLAGRPFEERVEELAHILDEDGYLAECVGQDDGSFRIVEHNCAILAVAAKYGAACGSELEFLREAIPDATIERVAHVIAGGHVCAYEVRRR